MFMWAVYDHGSTFIGIQGSLGETMRARHRFRVQPGTMRKAVFALWLVVGLLVGQAAHASVALLLEQPYGRVRVAVEPAGHAAVYLDHVCAETPVKLRPCGPGELGVVISRYDGIQGYDWIAVPLVPYLYAVEKAGDIPNSADRALVQRLRDEYRRGHLMAVAPAGVSDQPPPGNWYELVGSAFDRTIYGFQVDTTPAQDAALIAMMNDRPNVERYNGAFRNCADFARVTINRFYPHAVRRNFIADFGLTSPKSVARALTYYARKHPDVHLRTFVVPQVKGGLPRSHAPEDLTEGLLKRYGVALLVVSPVTAGVVLVAYVEHGRFSMPHNAPELNIPKLELAADEQARRTAEITTVASVRPQDAEMPADAEKSPATLPAAMPSLLEDGPEYGAPTTFFAPADDGFAVPLTFSTAP